MAPTIEPMKPTVSEMVGLDVVVLDELPQEAADERADDAEQDGADQADVVPAGHQQARDEPDDEADDDQYNYEFEHGPAKYQEIRLSCGTGCRAPVVPTAWFGADQWRALT